MIDERRNAPVGVVLRVCGCLLLELVEVEVDALIGEVKLGQDEGDLPVDGYKVSGTGTLSRWAYQPFGPPLWVKRVNCLPWDILVN